MLSADLPLIDDIRAASRQMVRELGFMEATLAATDYPPSAVHTILEIGIRGPMTSVQVAEFLHLEKSSVSRMVRKLIACGELKETSDADDARVKPLSLTPKGRRTLASLHDFGRRQVSTALARLPEAERQIVRDGMTIYARALRASRDAEAGLAKLTA
jgi:DNA-binding MarR family transcriptional regulator